MSVSCLKKISLSVIFSLSVLVNPCLAEDKLVGFGGVYTTGEVNENNFSNFQKNKTKIVQNFKAVLEKLNTENQLPFKVIFDTDAEGSKTSINDSPYSLAIIMTRDDISQESFNKPEDNISINKSYINVGMVAIIYQTLDDIKQKGKKKNSILYSFPIVGYSVNLSTGSNDLTPEALNDSFVKIAKTTFEEEIVKKLQNISLDKIESVVSEVQDGKFKIDVGSSKGLVKGQRVKFIANDKNISNGKIIFLDASSSLIESDTPKNEIFEGTKVQATNIKGLSEETYQVVDFKISSEKCRKWFDAKKIGPQASQWFSDFLSERGGKVVLPSKVGSRWINSSTEQSFALFIKDGQEHLFEVAKPKYSIILDITGLSDKKIEEESNNISENWIYKIWLNVEIPEKKYSKEFEMYSTKNVVVGTQTFGEKNEIFDLLHQLTAKSAKEIEIND